MKIKNSIEAEKIENELRKHPIFYKIHEQWSYVWYKNIMELENKLFTIKKESKFLSFKKEYKKDNGLYNINLYYPININHPNFRKSISNDDLIINEIKKYNNNYSEKTIETIKKEYSSQETFKHYLFNNPNMSYTLSLQLMNKYKDLLKISNKIYFNSIYEPIINNKNISIHDLIDLEQFIDKETLINDCIILNEKMNFYQYYYYLSKNEQLSWSLINFYKDFCWVSDVISTNKFINFDLIESLEWKNFVNNVNVNWKKYHNNLSKSYPKFIENNDFITNFKYCNKSFLASNPNITWNIVEKNNGKYNNNNDNGENLYSYNVLSNILPLEIIEKYIDKDWDFDDLSKRIDLNILKKYPRKNWNYGNLSTNINIPLKYINKHHKKKWSYNLLSMNRLSIKDIKKYENIKPNMYFLSSSDLITFEDYMNNPHLDWDLEKLKLNKNITVDIIENNKNIFNCLDLGLENLTFEFINNNIDLFSINPNNNLKSLIDSKFTLIRVQYIFDKIEQYKEMHKELIEKSWHPNRFRDWCLDIDEVKELC